MNQSTYNFVFFGTDDFAVMVLRELAKQSVFPKIIVTTPDKPQGRKLLLTPSPTKQWAQDHGIEILEPETLKDSTIRTRLQSCALDFFLVVSYGKIIPKSILSIPPRGVLNIHPSLLPDLRGPSPLETALLSRDKTGITIMKLDEEIDHGPVVVQEKYQTDIWPVPITTLKNDLAQQASHLLLHNLPDYLSGNIALTEQDHGQATYTKKITKQDGLIDLHDSVEKNYRIFCASVDWPRAFFFTKHNNKNIRVIIIQAHIKNGSFIIDRVIPEGRKEMLYTDFLKGIKT